MSVFSEMNGCSKSGIHEHSPNSQIHIHIFHGIAKLSSTDFPDYGEDGFHVMGCVRRYLEVVIPRRFSILLTFLVNWRTGPCARGSLQALWLWATGFPVLVSLCKTRSQLLDCRSLLNLFLLHATGFSTAFQKPAKVCILQSHLRSRRGIERAEISHPAVGFPRIFRHPRTLGFNRT